MRETELAVDQKEGRSGPADSGEPMCEAALTETVKAESQYLEPALSRDPAALRSLVDALAPVVRCQAALTLYKCRDRLTKEQLEQERDDLVQDVFVHLFEKNGKVLRSWDPERGLSLFGFVRLVTTRVVFAKLRSRRQNPWSEQAVDKEVIDALAGGGDDAETQVLKQNLLDTLIERLKETLSPLGFHLFVKLYVEEADIKVLSETENLSPTALYTWKSRIKTAIYEFYDQIVQENDGSRQIRKGG